MVELLTGSGLYLTEYGSVSGEIVSLSSCISTQFSFSLKREESIPAAITRAALMSIKVKIAIKITIFFPFRERIHTPLFAAL